MCQPGGKSQKASPQIKAASKWSHKIQLAVGVGRRGKSGEEESGAIVSTGKEVGDGVVVLWGWGQRAQVLGGI